ncbi:hypothetical protein ARMSODRAFT_899183 [Armillaria solidipes]|uniref:Uncharacterized protein n=1 Tax=Armillaria solidipes TaxID=1076256 RepID=A0A2H3B6N7_9AGAR|nr:hypothetical protein ARMSODRAFT_899183 [Armillaria solidipes]
MEDYQSYVRRRRQLFENNEILRAALKHGGLIWRLAVGIEQQRFEDVVLSGPSKRVTQIGGVRCTADGDELWDEMLTEDQIDIICGVYKKAESDRRGQLTEHVSWFPKPTAWKGSGLDVGFWSADDESWYLHRVAKYLDGDFKCENQTEWRKSLKLCRDAPKVSEALETASRIFLEKHVLSLCEFVFCETTT